MGRKIKVSTKIEDAPLDSYNVSELKALVKNNAESMVELAFALRHVLTQDRGICEDCDNRTDAAMILAATILDYYEDGEQEETVEETGESCISQRIWH